MEEKIILSVDPGSDKCGIAIIENQKGVIYHRVVLKKELTSEIEKIFFHYSVTHIIIGDGTNSSECKELISSLKAGLEIITVNEKFTTELARKRYFEDNPPIGWRSLIPLCFQMPPEPYDDYAAIILAERFQKNQEEIKDE